ncbi:Lipoprotein releasing system transmembrane protein LolC [hydrothermal vent metagenome]|uniref:Lipoprotein releasing system transmembrane protein LolC n=1 Tax=hydrothermal vent metagenome TaxID=652676 RepID=A0A3B0WIZ4_9ZZZZ
MWFKFAATNVLRNRRRGLATLLIVSVGTAGILISGGFALYTYDSLREMAARDNGHLILAHTDYFEKHEEIPLEYGLINFENTRKTLMQNELVRAVLPRLAFSGLISNGDKSSVFIGNGIDVNEFKVKGPSLRVSKGATLSSRPQKNSDPQIMIGEGLAKIMNAKPGDSLTLLSTTVEGSLNAQDVVVQGIFSIGVPEIDKRLLFTKTSTAQTLLLTNKISTLSVYLYDTDETNNIASIIKEIYPKLAIQHWLDTAFYYQAVRSLYNRIFGLLGIIILGMVFFAVTSNVSMSVFERTRETGTLRALGTYSSEIVRNFVIEALILGVMSIIVGMLIAGSVALFFSLAGLEMPAPPGRSQTYPLVIYADPLLYLITGAAILILCVTAAWLAGRRAVNKTIVEALGHV